MADDDTLQPQSAVDAATPGSSRVTRGVVVILWLLAVGGLVLLVPLTLLARNLGRQVDALHADLAAAERRIEAASTPGPTAQALLAELTQLEADAEALGAAQAEVVAGSYDYPAVMAAIAAYPRESVRIEALSQREDQLTVEGRADSEAAVAGYAQSLEASGLFAQVLLRALEAIPEGEREPLPPPEVVPGQATLTPTLSVTVTYPLTPALGSPTPLVGDAVAPDHSQPVAITLGEPLTRTFYPLYVLHRATFPAQAGAVYRVRTLNLAPGVDTFLVVTVGDATYVNHNRAPGELASEIMFQAHPTTSQPATVTVTNRGEYGPDKTYQLLVEQVPLTATPTPTLTVTPSPTATPTPTVEPTPTLTPPPPTPSRTPIPSATPPMPDPYEPDDKVPVPIIVGDTQQRTFYPQNDVDRVVFLAKAGRRYRVYTWDLSPEVDTLLFVHVGANTYINDDVAFGERRSEVIFEVTLGHDVQVRVDIHNRGLYGPTHRYNITVEEIVATPFPTSTGPPPVGVDPYEPDDVVPAVIAIGETQHRTFYPEGDIDQVTFLAKAGRKYEVFTSNLALGVDTVLAVRVGTEWYINEDRPGAAPGEYASSVTFRAPFWGDIQVVAEIRNKQGIYRPDASYEITVLEIATSWDGGARGPGLAAWRDGPTVAPAPRAAPQQIGPSAAGPVRFTLVLRPRLREAP